MIIAISSPPPFDTTELAEKLAAQNGLRVIQNPAPSLCREYGFQTLYDMPQNLQSEIRERLIREHADFVKTNNDLLLNFSVFGYLADWMRWFWRNTPTEKWEEMLVLAGDAASRYDEIHHIEAGESQQYDGYVWFDKRNSQQINGLSKYLYGEMNCNEKVKPC